MIPLVLVVNGGLIAALAGRLELRRYGLLSIGGLNLATVLLPHYFIAPLLNLMSGSEANSAQVYRAELIVALHLAGLCTGAMIARRRGFAFFRNRGGLDQYLGPIPRRGAFALGILGLFGVLYVALGTIDPFSSVGVSRTSQFRSAYLAYNLSYPILFFTGVTFFAQTLVMVAAYRRTGRRRAALTALGATLVATIVLLAFGSRNLLFMPLVLYLFVTHHYFRRVRTVFLLVAFVALVPIFVFFRLVASGNTLDTLSSKGLLGNNEFIASQFLARFHGFDDVVDYADWSQRTHQDLAAGTSYTDMAIRWVPRPIIPDKPPSLDVYLSNEIYGRKESGGSIHLFGGMVESHYNFGFSGVVLWGAALGYVLMRLHFSLVESIATRSDISVCLLLGNTPLLRGLVNAGIDTVFFQQFIMVTFAQVVLVSIGIVLSRQRAQSRLSPHITSV